MSGGEFLGGDGLLVDPAGGALHEPHALRTAARARESRARGAGRRARRRVWIGHDARLRRAGARRRVRRARVRGDSVESVVQPRGGGRVRPAGTRDERGVLHRLLAVPSASESRRARRREARARGAVPPRRGHGRPCGRVRGADPARDARPHGEVVRGGADVGRRAAVRARRGHGAPLPSSCSDSPFGTAGLRGAGSRRAPRPLPRRRRRVPWPKTPRVRRS